MTDSLERVIEKYPNTDLFVCDRNCVFAPSAQQNEKLARIKHWSVDKLH